MKELVFRYFWIIPLSLFVGVPYINWTAKSLFDIINSFKKTLKSRYDRLSLIEQMDIYISEATRYWIIAHSSVVMFIFFFGGIASFGYYLGIVIVK